MSEPTLPSPADLALGLGQRALVAARALAVVPRARKDAALLDLATRIEAATANLVAANALDLVAAEANGLAAPMIDRLRLTPARLATLAASVREVAALPDPVGEVLSETDRPNGLRLQKVRVPIGVIGIVYESRPNVTVDCAILCLKSGNASILRGGREAAHSNAALAALVRASLAAADLPEDAVQIVPTPDRAVLQALLKLDSHIHCFIPRGGEGLIRFVTANASVPVIKHYQGICNLFLDAAADPAKAIEIVINSKVQRPSACNAAENLWVHRDVLTTVLPPVLRALAKAGVTLRGDDRAVVAAAEAGVTMGPAEQGDFDTEFLGLTLAVGVVDNLDEAIAQVHRHGSGHSECIITEDAAAAEYFLAHVDSAAVFWNASTRFHDGFEFGLGAEIGISTDRLHARGPMGLEELTSYKWLIRGTGQVRG